MELGSGWSEDILYGGRDSRMNDFEGIESGEFDIDPAQGGSGRGRTRSGNNGRGRMSPSAIERDGYYDLEANEVENKRRMQENMVIMLGMIVCGFIVLAIIFFILVYTGSAPTIGFLRA